MLIAVSVAFSAGRHVWYRQTGDPIFGISTARGESSTPVPLPTDTVQPTLTSFVEIAPTSVIEFVQVVVTATPTPELPTPEVIYVNVPYEVERVVTNTVEIVHPTPTPHTLAPGTVEICVRVEGAREIYIHQSGVVSGSCMEFAFGVGQTSIPVQINR